MVEFAQAMATVLEQLNIDSFQNFELRIGNTFNKSIKHQKNLIKRIAPLLLIDNH